jgi:hypothetical protein
VGHGEIVSGVGGSPVAGREIPTQRQPPGVGNLSDHVPVPARPWVSVGRSVGAGW